MQERCSGLMLSRAGDWSPGSPWKIARFIYKTWDEGRYLQSLYVNEGMMHRGRALAKHKLFETRETCTEPSGYTLTTQETGCWHWKIKRPQKSILIKSGKKVDRYRKAPFSVWCKAQKRETAHLLLCLWKGQEKNNHHSNSK